MPSPTLRRTLVALLAPLALAAGACSQAPGAAAPPPPSTGGGGDTGGGGGGAGGGGGGGGGGGLVVEPQDPGTADVVVAVDTTAAARPISPFIYGLNGMVDGSWGSGVPSGLGLNRFGGNRLTAYNWESNWSNAGSDWNFSNDNYLAAGTATGDAVAKRADATFAKGAAIAVTVPILGYVAADGNGSVASPFPNLSRFLVSQARNPAGPTATPDKGDGFVYQDDFVTWVAARYPAAATDPRKTILYTLDNEPDLWPDTHAEIRSTRASWQELRDKTIEYASMVKDVVPTGAVLAPGNYGWLGLVDLQGGAAPAGTSYAWFFDYLLDELAAEEAATGRRVVDVYDLHWYTEAKTASGTKVCCTTTDTADVIAARVQAPRSLWDPDYVENSWITSWNIPDCTAANGKCAIRLLPRLAEHVAAHYPGTKLAITEMFYGGADYASGAVAQADVLGIFGREGLYASALWPLNGGGADYRCALGAYAAYVNYDGAGAAFGDTSIATAVQDALRTATTERVTAYGSVDAGDPNRVIVVAINKTLGSLHAAIEVRHTLQLTRAEVYTLQATTSATTPGCTGPARGADVALPVRNGFVAALPPLSVTVYVLRP